MEIAGNFSRVQDGGAANNVSNVTGARITASAIISIQGVYRGA